MKKIFLLPLLLLLGAIPTHAQFSRINSITLTNNNNTQAAFFASPFTLKVGANCTWSVTGTIATLNCAGGGGAPGGNNGEIQYDNAGAFGGVTGLVNGLGIDCDGFLDPCFLRGTVSTFTYPITVTDTNGPAGNYSAIEMFYNVVTPSMNTSIDAYDGTNFQTLQVNSVNGPTASSLFLTDGPRAGRQAYNQGTTNAATVPCSISTTICEQAPTVVTHYVLTKPPVAAQGTLIGRNTAAVITQGFSGDADHSATVTTGSGASIGSTLLCSTTNCPVGTYRVNAYLDITTACTTGGTYLASLIYTDDQGSKTVPINLSGTGSVPATGVVTISSSANFGQAAQILRSTGAASINYSTTAVACATGGPMVGKLYLSVEPIQ